MPTLARPALSWNPPAIRTMAIARALLTKPEILILDDATSSVDPETELEIFREIHENISGTTVITVTHRESALRFSDRVFSLNDGILSEEAPAEKVPMAPDEFHAATNGPTTLAPMMSVYPP